MSKKKIVLYSFLIIFIGIQFFRPAKNSGETESENEIYGTAEIRDVLKASCYDCHSSNTNYPWYTAIQPVGWWLNHHVDEGKEELNFSEYESYSLKRKLRKLKEIKEDRKSVV